MAQVPSYVPEGGLVAWYDFDNNVTDASENAHNGSVFGASFVDSPLNGAVSFDGSDDYLEIPTSPVFEDMIDELTLSAWFKKTNSNTGTIVAKRNFVGNPCGERHHFELTCMPDNSVFFSASHNCIELNNTQVQSAPDVFQLNEWTHVAVTYDNGALLMYVNGELVLEHDEGYRELLPNNHWINFGRIHRSGGVSFFNEYAGEIDESGIWNRVLSAEEIDMLVTGQAASSVPEYVPSEGLVAWWGMDGNGEDSHTGTHDATNLTATPATDRFGNENGALMFSGSDEMRGPGGGNMDAGLSNAITLSCWLNASQFAQNQGTAVFRHSPPGVYYNWALHLSPLGDDSNSNHPYFLAGQSLFENNGGNVSEFALQLGEWHHVVLRVVDGLVDMHVDGIEVFSNQTNSSFQTTSNAEFVFGSPSHSVNDSFTGLMDDVGVWNRGISDAEILALYQVQSPTMGCTDDTACNYNPEANFNDDSCFYGCQFCGFGTVWDAESQTCVVAIPAYLNEPGEAAILNPCYFDSNGNGLVEVTDLMNVLSVYGMECGDVPEAAEFSCGDALNYQGYDYETVLIGEQCWFAENLKKLDVVFPGTSQSYDDPRSYVYGYNGENVAEAILQANYDEFGVLYNYAAVQDEDLCPAGWSPGTDEDWNKLAVALGVDSSEAHTYVCCGGAEYRGDVAPLMKDESWGGLNTSGFGALPGGYLNDTPSTSSFLQKGVNGYFWTTSEAIQYYASQGALEQTAMSHYLFDGIDGVGRIVTNRRHAFSVRCVKDAE